jgi:hypothetical protein
MLQSGFIASESGNGIMPSVTWRTTWLFTLQVVSAAFYFLLKAES